MRTSTGVLVGDKLAGEKKGSGEEEPHRLVAGSVLCAAGPGSVIGARQQPDDADRPDLPDEPGPGQMTTSQPATRLQ